MVVVRHQLARYARDKRVLPVQAFKDTLIWNINWNLAQHSPSPENISQIKQIINNQVIAFNKRYPKYQVNLQDVMSAVKI
jgi:hypothetical protein